MVFGFGLPGQRSFGTTVNDLLGVFNIKGAGIGLAIDSLTGNTVGQLQNMHDAMLECALGRGTGPIERQLGQMGIPPGLFMPSPMSAYPAMMPLCGCGYGGAQQIDLAPGSSNIPIFSKLFDPQRRMAGQFERQLRNNPYARAAFEAQIGGRIIDFGIRNDGKFTIQRFAPGFAPVPGMAFNPLANNAFGYMAGMNSAAMMGGYAGMGAGGMYGGNPFMGYMAGGFNNILGAGGMYGGQFANPGVYPSFGSAQTVGIGSPQGFNFAGLQTSLGGQGVGSWNPQAQPGQINNTNPLRDPSLTVEDKVTLMIMLIMKKMDQDIERQAQYINSIQQQQGGKGKGGGAVGGQAGGLDNQSSPSIDVETMKLKRMIDKRSQMFDMLRQIIDKYNQTAKGIIDSMGR